MATLVGSWLGVLIKWTGLETAFHIFESGKVDAFARQLLVHPILGRDGLDSIGDEPCSVAKFRGVDGGVLDAVVTGQPNNEDVCDTARFNEVRKLGGVPAPDVLECRVRFDVCVCALVDDGVECRRVQARDKVRAARVCDTMDRP